MPVNISHLHGTGSTFAWPVLDAVLSVVECDIKLLVTSTPMLRSATIASGLEREPRCFNWVRDEIGREPQGSKRARDGSGAPLCNTRTATPPSMTNP